MEETEAAADGLINPEFVVVRTASQPLPAATIPAVPQPQDRELSLSRLAPGRRKLAPNEGADVHTVALLLGHKDLRMAARYQHLSPTFLADAVRGLDAAFKECHHYVTGAKALLA
jgi:hypothetical protein